ncbi:MAG: bifunctional DedA family/phosphatase PAP2 family protein [Solirubrobacterales bacterium]|nr:bifunctional DedA family/phosphatase PAP2 family protein [Solirubrobacterales bacterium]
MGRRHLYLLVAGAVAAVVVYLLYRQFFPELDLQQLLDDFANLLGDWTYLVVGVLAFLETGAFVGLLVPGETALLVGGAVAGQGVISVYLLIAIAWIMAFLGDTTSFWLGHRLGREFVLRHGPRFGITRERFEMVEDYYDRHGGKTVLIGRFIGVVRALSPFVAGSSDMKYRAFVPYSVLGSGLQVTAHILAGYFFARSIDAAAEYVGIGALILGTVIVVSVVAVVLYRYLRDPANRERTVAWMDAHRATVPLVRLGRRFRPQFRFAVARLTPGGTFGLEVTTLCAILAVSSFVLVAYTAIVTGDAGPTPGDQRAIDFVNLIQTARLTDLAKLITVLGSSAVLLPLVAITAVLLGLARRWTEMVVLLLSATAIWVGVDLFKDAVGRPRPDGGLVTVSGYSFPSGHAAYSVFYVWLTVTIAVRIRPSMARGTALALSGLALTILVGLSRVYLDVHYLSDVFAGWALGAFCFAFFAVAALLLGQLRKN